MKRHHLHNINVDENMIDSYKTFIYMEAWRDNYS